MGFETEAKEHIVEEALKRRKMKLVMLFALLGIAFADPTVYFKEEFGDTGRIDGLFQSTGLTLANLCRVLENSMVMPRRIKVFRPPKMLASMVSLPNLINSATKTKIWLFSSL